MIELLKRLASQKDKHKHFIVSALLVIIFTALLLVVTSTTVALLGAFSITVMIGIGKEFYDSLGHGTEDIEDIYADVLGALLGLIIGTLGVFV